MRICPSIRRYLRLRFGLRSFVMSVAAVYFTAMYIFHSGLDGSSSLDDRRPVRRWDMGGDDDRPQRRRLPVERLDADLQDVFDNIRQVEQQQKQQAMMETRRAAVNFRPRPPSSFMSDVNVPPSCNTSERQQRQRANDFVQLSTLYLLSAFWDERPNDFDNRHNGTIIRIMAVLRAAAAKLTLVCDFGSHQTAVSYYEMCENHRRPYGSFILSCNVPEIVTEAPCFVTVMSQSSAGDSKVEVPVTTLRPHSVHHSFSVCVPPLFGDVSPSKLVEFFELTFLLGADHVVIYDSNTAPTTRAVVYYYAARCRGQRRCRVDIIDWRLPEAVASAMWYHGQSLAIQDCLYRQMASSQYVIFNDIDEFLVPHGHQLTNWTHLVAALDRPLSCAFQFASAFFQPAAMPASVDNKHAYLMTMRSTERSQHFSSIRTKCMVRPYDVFEAGIHHISKPIWAHLTVNRVDTEVAFLHHYRKCVALYGMNCAGTVDDRTIRRYFDDLVRTTSDVWTELLAINNITSVTG